MPKLKPAALVSLTALLSCSQPQQRTIEPTAPAQGPSGGGTNGSTTDNDEGFTLSRAPRKSGPVPADYPIHLAEKWYPFRGEYLGVSEKEAITRDAGLPDGQGPAKFWDEQTAIEAVSIWSALCNECHGGRRKIQDALKMTGPKSEWGKGEGLFFGKRRPYREIFRIISNGGPERNGKPSEMPAWKARLSREQIWSLIYFLEYQSGGIEGVFPPSLYPRPAEGTGD
jgi:hypothetical protein